VCKGTPKACDDSNSCTADACNPYTAICENLGAPGTCTDGNACTLDDRCVGGVCVTDKSFVDTIAGIAQAGDQDGKGDSARFNAPRGIVVDAQGTAIVADAGNHRIRKVLADGTTTTIAGTGTPGFVDGGASSAQFYTPTGLCSDGDGGVYVSDSGNHRVRRLDKSGNVSTVAGSGAAGYFDGAPTSAQFKTPYGIARGSDGVLIVADSGNNRIRTIATDGTVGTLAGSGQAGFLNGAASSAAFNLPSGVAIDGGGAIWITDMSNYAIRRIKSGNVETVAGFNAPGFVDGKGMVARFATPYDIAVDGAGNAFVADRDNRRVRKITPDGTVSTHAGDGTQAMLDGLATAARLAGPIAVAVAPSSHLYVGDSHALRKISQPALPCVDGEACTTDSCDPAKGKCVFTPLGEGNACSDGDACTTGDVCKSGVCAGATTTCGGGLKCWAGSCARFTDSALLDSVDQDHLGVWLGDGSQWKSCFKKSVDGASAAIAHAKCDNQGPIIAVVENSLGHVFGGYTAVSWSSSGGYFNSTSGWLFTFKGGATKLPYYQNPATAFYFHPAYGPTWGGGHDLYTDGALNGYVCPGYTYNCTTLGANSSNACSHGVSGYNCQQAQTFTEVEIFIKM